MAIDLFGVIRTASAAVWGKTGRVTVRAARRRAERALRAARQESARYEALTELEPRLLFTAPALATQIPTQVLPVGGNLTLGIDGFDADNDALTITASVDDPNVTVQMLNEIKLATMHYFSLDANGQPTIPLGDIKTLLFQNAQSLAVNRFIELATKHIESKTDTDRATIAVGTPPGNKPPVNTLLPTYSQANGTTLALTGISVADPAVGGGAVKVTLSVTSGTLNLLTNVTGGVTAAQVTGQGSGTVTITAPVATINNTLAAVNGLVITKAADSTTVDTNSITLTMTTNDQAVSSPQSDTETSTIHFGNGPIILPPVNTLPSLFTTAAGQAVVLSGISVTSVETTEGDVKVTFAVTGGTLSIATGVTNGIASGDVTGNGTASITVTATLAQINTTLADAAGLTFTPAAGSALVTLTMTTSAPTISDATALHPAFYTNVPVHRVIPNFVIQTGDPVNGNGTGGSGLGTFADMPAAGLTFNGLGTLAMANSGANSNDSQFFITAPGANPLPANTYMIFGQQLSGQDAFFQIINSARDGSDRPFSVPVLRSVDISDTTQDNALVLTTDPSWDGDATLTITLDDGHGNVVQNTVHLVKSGTAANAGGPGAAPVIGNPGTTRLSDGTVHLQIPGITDDNGAPDLVVRVNQANVTATIDSSGMITFTTPPGSANYFLVTVSGFNHGFGGLLPTPTEVSFTVVTQPSAPPHIESITPNTQTTTASAFLQQLAGNGIQGQSNGFAVLGTTIVGNLLYVGGSTTVTYNVGTTQTASFPEFRVFDISDPGNPVLLGSTATANNGQPRDIKIVGQTAFVADTFGGLTAINIADPAHPAVISSLAMPGVDNGSGAAATAAIGLFIEGTTAYVAAYQAGLVIVNIANPAQMVQIARFQNYLVSGIADDTNHINTATFRIEQAVGVVKIGNTVWVSDIGGQNFANTFTRYNGVNVGLVAVDVTKVTEPKLLGFAGVNSAPWGLTHIGNFLYAASSVGLIVLNVSNPRAAQQVKLISGNFWQITLSPDNKTAYLADSGIGYAMLDTSVISNPKIVGKVLHAGGGVIPSFGGSQNTVAALPFGNGAELLLLDNGLTKSTTYTIHNEQVVLSVTSGTLDLRTDVPNGVTAAQIVGDKTGRVTITAPLAAIQATLAASKAVMFTPAPNFTGGVTLTMTTNDLASSGTGGPRLDFDSSVILVSPMNLDAVPVNTLPTIFTTAQDTAVNLHGISVTDSDAAANPVKVTLAVGTGTLNLRTDVINGITADQITGNGTANVVITAPIDVINATLADMTGVTFTPASLTTGLVTLTMNTNDQASTGGGPGQDLDSSSILVGSDQQLAGVNRAPINALPLSYSVDQNKSIALTGVNVTDVDAGLGSKVTINPGNANVIVSQAPNGDIDTITILGSDRTTSVSITTSGAPVTIGNLIVGTITDTADHSSIGSINAPTINIGGNVIVTGAVGNLTLGDILDNHTISIGSDATAGTPKTANITLGNVANTNIGSAIPIGTLSVKSWLDSDSGTVDTITAPGIITALKSAGDFQADLVLSGTGIAATGNVLGTVTIAHNLTAADWSVTGKVGAITVTGTTEGLNLHNVTTAGTLNLGTVVSADVTLVNHGAITTLSAKGWAAGTVTAGTIGTLSITGNMAAALVLTPPSVNAPAKPKAAITTGTITGTLTGNWDINGSVGSITVKGATTNFTLDGGAGSFTGATGLTFNDVTNSTITSTGVITKLAVHDWASGAVTAKSIGTISATNDFFPLLTLTGAATGNTLGAASIAGDITGTWSIQGAIGTVTVKGNAAAWAITGETNITSLNFAAADSVTVTATGTIGTITAWQYTNAHVTAKSVGTLSIKGNTNIMMGALAAGDFSGTLTLSGAATGNTLGTATIKGNVTGHWAVTGKGGTITAGSSDTDWNANFSDVVTTLSLTGVFSGVFEALAVTTFKAGSMTDGNLILDRDFDNTKATQTNATTITVTGAMTGSLIQSDGSLGAATIGTMNGSAIVVGLTNGFGTVLPPNTAFANTTAFLNSLTIKGVTGQPNTDAFTDSIIAAPVLGTVTMCNVHTDNAGTPFGVEAFTIKNYTRKQGTTTVATAKSVSGDNTIESVGDYIARTLAIV